MLVAQLIINLVHVVLLTCLLYLGPHPASPTAPHFHEHIFEAFSIVGGECGVVYTSFSNN